METIPLAEVMNAARRLPPEAQAELAGALLKNLSGTVHPKEPKGQFTDPPGAPLEVLTGADDEELRVLADTVVPESQQRRLRRLLRKTREGTLTLKERVELDALLEEGDRVALLKAKALYTLKQREQAAGGRA